MKKQKKKGFLSTCLLLILVLVILYSGLQILESTVLHPSNEAAGEGSSKTITRDGVDYFPRQDIHVMMVLGIDQAGPVESSNYYRNEGAADSIMLLIFDETNEECTILYLNRDTMLNMDVLGVKGDYAGTTYAQLALAHTYGEGLEDSCVNMKNTLEKYLHGLSIDYYVSMNMDAIPIMNDAVGGVTVTVVDDFSQANPSITMGELTLQGDQVIDFVRRRKDVGDQKNITRMARQREYVAGFLEQLSQAEHEDINFLVSLYEDIAPYIVTDCSVETLSSMLDRYLDYSVKEVVSPVGENIVNDGHYEFHVDEEKLDELIVRLFYAPKKQSIFG